ncbi:MAG TPA: tripartite tricarboxylate transporter TctB family protein, partial [Paenibacillaceae bacterium]
AGLILLAFSVFVFWQSFSLKYRTAFGPGPGMFPRWLSGILIVLSAIYIWQSARKEIYRVSDVLPKGKNLWDVASVVVAVILFMLLVNRTGFMVAGTAMLLIVLIRHFKWYAALAVAFVTSLILFLIFRQLLGIPLPVNAFGW